MLASQQLPILFKDIQQQDWDSAAKRAQKTAAAIVLVHPNVLDDRSKSQIPVLLSQTLAPVIVLSEAHNLFETKKWLVSNQCIEHVIVPTVPGWPYPFLCRDDYNKSLSDQDLANALQTRAYKAPTSFGEIETSSSTPSPSAADYGHKQLAGKLKSIGVQTVYVAGGYFSSPGFGCAGILLQDFNNHFGLGCIPTELITPKTPDNAISPQQVLDELTLQITRHG